VIMRQYVNNITTEGLNVTTDGNTLTLTAGTITIPHEKATLETDQMFVFLPEAGKTNVLIGFDRFGRLFVEWNTPRPDQPVVKAIICQRDGTRVYMEQQASKLYGIMTHLVYFDLPAGEVDLSNIIVNVVRGRAA
jgi:hypothetical protein